MVGETDLNTLLASMSPRLSDEEYVFCTIEAADYGAHAELHPIVSCTESEGLTLVIPKAKAQLHQIRYQAVFKRITLSVHSSLDAVGLTAAFSRTLAGRGISANVIAGFHHDHIFVHSDAADEAVAALEQLAESARTDAHAR